MKSVAILTVKAFLISFLLSTAASAATIQSMVVPPRAPADKQRPAPMPAPADTSHYAASPLGTASNG